MMKLCKHCRWAKAPEGGLRSLHKYDFRCLHETSLERQHLPDYVLGQRQEPRQMRCLEARDDPERCGPHGRHWEPPEDGVPDDENPELTAADFARGRPFKEVFPEQYKAWKEHKEKAIIEEPISMTVTYDAQADAVGIIFAGGPSEGEEVHPGVILHFDAANRIVEIEILSASKVLASEATKPE